MLEQGLNPLGEDIIQAEKNDGGSIHKSITHLKLSEEALLQTDGNDRDIEMATSPSQAKAPLILNESNGHIEEHKNQSTI